MFPLVILKMVEDMEPNLKVTRLCSTLCDPTLWNSPDQNTGLVSLSLLQGIFPTQGSNPGLPALQVDSLPAESLGKPKNTGVNSQSLFQQIFPSQEESNRGLLHCRQILSQLSYQGSHGTQHRVIFHTALSRPALVESRK